MEERNIYFFGRFSFIETRFACAFGRETLAAFTLSLQCDFLWERRLWR